MKTLKAFLSPVLFLFLVGSVLSVSAQTVYITKTGEKYHDDGCRYLSKSAYSISLANAKEKGYTACKVCKPTAKVSTTPKAGTSKAQKPSYKASQTRSLIYFLNSSTFLSAGPITFSFSKSNKSSSEE